MFYLASPNSVYSLYNDTVFKQVNEISIVGNTSTNLPVVIQCEPPIAGLSFLNVADLTISNIQFLNCASPRNSTSRNFTKPNSMLMINVGLYFYNCTNINMYNVEVVNSSQAIGVVMYDNDGMVNITNCTFADNEVSEDVQFPGGGALAIEFTYCKPGNMCNGTNYDPHYRKNKNSVYSLTSCTFSDNHARGQNSANYGGKLSLASNSSHSAVGQGGAISIYVKGDATGNSVSIANCHFVNNKAEWGGGLHLEMDDNANNNSIYISDCAFIGNQANHENDGTGGGGIFISITMYFWDEHINTRLNRVHINYSLFTNNSAIEGGGLAFAITHLNGVLLTDPTKLLVVSSCWFESNKARLGSAVAVFNYPIVNDGYLPTVIFEDSTFTNNHIVYIDNDIHPLGTGAVYTNEVPLEFKGTTSFISNSGSALSAVGDKVTFDDYSSALFNNNRGVFGGGIALLGTAFLLVGENVEMNFTNNCASQYGGAIYNEYSSREDVKSSINCFIRYKKPFVAPIDWEVLFYFSNNTAKQLGKSIYSTAILPCLYGEDDVAKIFCWNDKQHIERWIYEESNCSDEIHTQPRSFSSSSLIDAYPGYAFHLPLVAWDDLNHNVTDDSVYYAYINENSKAISEVKPGYTHVASNYISITGKPNNEVKLVMQTERSRLMHVCLHLNLKTCPPGFDLVHNSSDPKTLECNCNRSGNNNYHGHIRCNNQPLKSQIDTKYWYGLVNDSHSYLMGHMPIYFASNVQRITSTSSFIDIPDDPNEVGEYLCTQLNRTGVLCGECLPDYAVAVNSPTYECVRCNDTSQAKKVGDAFTYILLTYGPITVLFMVIVLCNLNLASSAAAGFVLYAQIISSEFFDITAYQLSYDQGVEVSQKRFQKAYIAIYGILNLRSFSFLRDPFCLINSKSFNILSVLCLDYAIAIYPIIVIIGVHLAFCCPCHKCERWCESQQLYQRCRQLSQSQTTSVPRNRWVNSFVAFMILSYSKFGLASMKTLQSNKLFNATGDAIDHRVYVAGQLSYPADSSYLGYAIGAIFIAVLFVFLPPLLLLVIINLINWLTGKIEFLRKFWCGDKVHIYLNAFEGYKTNRRWFAGVYLLFRLIMFIVYCFTPTILIQYLLQQILILSLIILVALLRPYEADFYNYWDTILLFILGILNLSGIYMFVNGFSNDLYIAEGILVFIPLVLYSIGYTFRKCCLKYGKNQLDASPVNKFICCTDPLPSSARLQPNERTSLLNRDQGLEYRAQERNRYKAATPTAPPTASVVDIPK